MSERYDQGGAGIPERRRTPRLGRLSVFVIGLALGFVGGGIAGVAAWQAFAPEAASNVAENSAPGKAGPARGAPAKTAMKPPPAKGAAVATSGPPAPQALRAVEGRPLRVGVFGDSLGDGLWAGLYRRLHGDKRFVVSRFSQASTGLTRYDYVDVGAKTAGQLEGQALDAAVVLFGANDEQAISTQGVIHPFGSDGWREIYQQRMAGIVDQLRQHGASAIYWVGLPRMKRTDYDARAQVLNNVMQAEAQALGVSYVSTLAATMDGAGAYQDYLPAHDGDPPVLMRARDGIHMTMEGYLRLAGPVAGRLLADAGPIAPAEAAVGPDATPAPAPPAAQ